MYFCTKRETEVHIGFSIRNFILRKKEEFVVKSAAPAKQRNYAVEFYRMMFCLSFAAIHVWQVLPTTRGQKPAHMWALDCMLPFMAFSGYFLMQGYQSKKKKAAAAGVAMPAPSVQAATYLWSRVKALWPVYIIGTLMGMFVMSKRFGTTLAELPVFILNTLPELVGIQITGIGIGNNYVGNVELGVTGSAGSLMLNAPLWFISAIFIAGYIVYYAIAWNEELYLGLVTPVATAVLFATHHLGGTDPMWLYYDTVGSFMLNCGLLKMICLMSVGALMWKGVNKLKDVEFTKGFTVFLTIIQTAMGIFFVYRTWTPYTASIGLDISFSSIYLLSIPFTFLLLLNKDGFTHFMNMKIWEFPGKLALYFYIVHYPTMMLLGRFIQDLKVVFIALVIVSSILAILLYLLNDKLLQPWLKNHSVIVKKEAATK